MNIKQAIFGLGPKPYSPICDCGGKDPESRHFGACFGECATRQPRDGYQGIYVMEGDHFVTVARWKVPPRRVGLMGHIKRWLVTNIKNLPPKNRFETAIYVTSFLALAYWLVK